MKKIIKLLTIIVVLTFGCILFVLSHRVGGWQAFIVSSGSMEPAIRTGSLVVTKYAKPNKLVKNDIITFISPAKEHQFITHRIQDITYNTDLTIIKTKGDHNKSSDSWTLAGGGVVGKVLFIIPYLGYFFSFTQVKIGSILFILLPSVYILYSEITFIFDYLKKGQKNKNIASAIKIALLLLFGLGSTASYTHTLLNASVTLASNQFTTANIVPTPTQPCGHNDSISISKNGNGSTNNVYETNGCQKTVNQSNSSGIHTNITSSANSGGNIIGNNTFGETIKSSQSSSNVWVTVTQNKNN